MREYFLDLLNNLDTLAGLRQLEKIYAAAGDDRGAAITEINKLLTALENVSKLFPYIPEAEQQKIINLAVISEEFPNLNANLVYRWLNRHRDKYFKESHHVKQEQEAPPVTGEAKQKWIDKWMQEVDKIGKSAPVVMERDAKMEWLRKRPVEMQEQGYTPPTEEEVRSRELHIRYIRENYDPYTGKQKEGWISEEEWLKRKNCLHPFTKIENEKKLCSDCGTQVRE